MGREQEVKREVFAITLIIIIFVSLIGTFTILSVTEKLKEPKDTSKEINAPGVSFAILQQQNTEQEEDKLTNGNK